jgi:hypothetical protein
MLHTSVNFTDSAAISAISAISEIEFQFLPGSKMDEAGHN